jgi:4-amino-4-deoxy-L-arabinose transferase-like glycosyltransferase
VSLPSIVTYKTLVTTGAVPTGFRPLALISPLIWFIIQKPQLGLTLLGVPSALPVDFGLNVVTVLKQYFLFWEPSTAEVLRPVFGLGSVLLVVLGLHRLILTRETTRSYLIIFWIICLLPVLIFNPSFTTVTFVPTVLMLAAGLTSLITYWYRLFPLNPYARIAGLIPIIILVAALITSGITRYVYGYHYGPKVAPLFSKDLILLPKDTKQLVVSEDEFSFYQAVASYSKNYEVVKSPTAKEFVVTHNAKSNIQNYNVKRIITNSMYKQADRFYVLEQKQQ